MARQAVPVEKQNGFPVRVRHRIKRSGNESLRDAARRMVAEKDLLKPHIERWFANKR